MTKNCETDNTPKMNEWKPDICIYHGNCNDGFGAAVAVRERWGDDVQYVPASYGKPLDVSVDEQNLLFVDFSLKRDELMALVAPRPSDTFTLPAKSIVVLDHHKTAKDELASFTIVDYNNDAIGFESNEATGLLDNCNSSGRPPIIAYFDMEQSGARLAWEFCHYDKPLPRLISHIEDRDLWRFALPWTREVHAALCSYPQDFKGWPWSVIRDDGLVQELANEGRAILRYTKKHVDELCALASMQPILTHTVPCVNAPWFLASDIGHELLRLYPDAPFAVTYQIVNWRKQYSLRSEDTRLDVSEVAKELHGGGHRNAAGFSVIASA